MLHPQEGEHNSQLLKCGLHTVTSFQRGLYGKGGIGGSTFTLDKSEKRYLSQGIMVRISNNVTLDVCTLDI